MARTRVTTRGERKGGCGGGGGQCVHEWKNCVCVIVCVCVVYG